MSSLFVGVIRLSGSNLSVASTHKSVSRLATRAIVSCYPNFNPCDALKVWKTKLTKNEFISSGTGTDTKSSD